jgi:xanthosine utilization system XapX-like protein
VIDDLLPFAFAVAVVGIAGVVIGMLVVPRLERMTEPKDEDAGDD